MSERPRVQLKMNVTVSRKRAWGDGNRRISDEAALLNDAADALVSLRGFLPNDATSGDAQVVVTPQGVDIEVTAGVTLPWPLREALASETA